MKNKSSLTPLYALVQGAFWMSFCASVCFAAVHLQGLGFSNTQLGAVMAAGNVLGTLLGPAMASYAERRPALGTARLNLPLFALRALALLVLSAFPGRFPLAAASYTAYIAACIAVNSLNLKLCVDAEHRGLPLDYGAARAAGSLAFVGLSALLGLLVERRSVAVLPWVGFALLGLQMAANAMIAQRLGPPESGAAAGGDGKESSSLLGFLREQKRFGVFLLGSALIFFAHNASCNFLINVVANVGGDAAVMGYLNAFMAAMEVPVMLRFSRVLRGKRVSDLLRISLLVFALKTIAIALAPGIPQLFAAHILQAFSFALYTCAVVPYVSRVIPYRDAAKAQSLAFSMTTLGAVLSSLVAGYLYDVCSVRATMLTAFGVCLLGAGIALAGTAATPPEGAEPQEKME